MSIQAPAQAQTRVLGLGRHRRRKLGLRLVLLRGPVRGLALLVRMIVSERLLRLRALRRVGRRGLLMLRLLLRVMWG